MSDELEPAIEWTGGLQYFDSLKEYPQFIPWRPETKQPHAIHRDTENTMSWSDPGNWSSFDDGSLMTEDPRLEGAGFVLQDPHDPYRPPADPFCFIDLDDVRNPETGAVHPTAAEFVAEADTYTAISTSGTGIHIIGKGQLPDGVKTIQAELPDDPDFPTASIEVYDGKRFIALTGKHSKGTPTEANEIGAFLHELTDRFVSKERCSPEYCGEEWDTEQDFDDPQHDRDEIQEVRTTTKLDVIADAISHVTPEDVTLKSQRTEVRSDDDKKYSFDPAWGDESESGTRLGYDGAEMGWIYRDGNVDIDALQVVALEENIISSPYQYPSGADWWEAITELRNRGAHIPYFENPAWHTDVPPLYSVAQRSASETKDKIDPRPVSQLPVAQLNQTSPATHRTAAQNRDLNWPETDEARERLRETIHNVMRHEDNRIIDAPTALGKTFTTATECWGTRDEVTDERPVVHLLETREARDEAIEAAEENGGVYMYLESRTEACPVCSGEHDPETAGSDTQVITVNSEPASQVINHLCDHKGLPFSTVHLWVKENCDQEIDELPCGGDSCQAIAQWEQLREGPDSNSDNDQHWPLIIATHNFAHAPGLRQNKNIVIDELPDYRVELPTERVTKAINAFLEEIDAPDSASTWEAFIMLSQHDGMPGGGKELADTVQKALDRKPSPEWYFEHEDAHVLAPALARAIWYAEERGNGRRANRVTHQPPRLDASARSDEQWNRQFVTVVLNEKNKIELVRSVPDFGGARSVIGLDARPAEPVWQANTWPTIPSQRVLNTDDRRLWRKYERGLQVIQVGDATRPLSGSKAREWFREQAVSTLLNHLRSEYGTGFRTALTTSQVEPLLAKIMENVGINNPETMHYGEEKSRNDFSGEPVGFVNGCMDPGDDYVLNLLAELDLDAEPEMETDEDGERYRARGREFTGEDADSAASILASVRENHVAQAVGRYARDPDDPDDNATVFLRTDAAPPGLIDRQVPGVQRVFTDTQQAIVEVVRDAASTLTAQNIADKVGCTREYVRQVLETLQEETGGLQKRPGEGNNGSTLYADGGLPTQGVINITEESEKPPTTPYWDSSKDVLEVSSVGEAHYSRASPVRENPYTPRDGADGADKSSLEDFTTS